jgi:hypothetical protein
MLKRNSVWTIAFAAAFLGSSPATARTVSIPFSPASFSNSTTINNTYFPLVPGTTYRSESATADGCEVDVSTVTYPTRVIDGVTTAIVHDSVYDGQSCTTAAAALTEDTFDYYAQDNAENVWYMGEDTFTCQGAGNCTPADGGWIAGVNAAQPGIIMLANPQSGDRYRQEYLPGTAEDQAVVDSVGVRAKMTRSNAYQSSYSNCVVTKEFTVLEKGAIEFKSYCPGVGMVQTVEHHGKVVISELTSISGTANALRFRTPTH